MLARQADSLRSLEGSAGHDSARTSSNLFSLARCCTMPLDQFGNRMSWLCNSTLSRWPRFPKMEVLPRLPATHYCWLLESFALVGVAFHSSRSYETFL